MSQESAASNPGAAPVTQYREPWTYSERRWEPDFMAPEVKLQPLHKVASKPIVWEGDARLPRGAVTIIAGEHGAGKSLMAIDWAARISRGEPWAASCASGSATNRNGEPEASASVSNRQAAARMNGEPEASASVSHRQAAARINGEPEASASVSFGVAGSQFKTEANASGSPNAGSPRAAQPINYGETVIAHAGDTTVELLRMRVDAAKAVPLRVASLALAWPEKGQSFTVDSIYRRVCALTCAIRGTSNVRLLVIDNLEAWAGNLQTPPSWALVNFLLTRLGELAALADLAIVVMAHLPHSGGQAAARKLEALSNVATVVYLAADDPERPSRKLLLPVKNTLAPPAPAKACDIVNNRAVWSDDCVNATADEFIAPLSRRLEARHEREFAASWLLAALADGPVASRELFLQARECGISTKTLRRAAQSLGLAPRKSSFAGPWQWQLGDLPSPTPGEPEASASVSHRQPAAPKNGEPEASASVSFGAASSQFKTEADASGSPDEASQGGQPRTNELAPFDAEDRRYAANHNARNGQLTPCGV